MLLNLQFKNLKKLLFLWDHATHKILVSPFKYVFTCHVTFYDILKKEEKIYDFKIRNFIRKYHCNRLCHVNSFHLIIET